MICYLPFTHIMANPFEGLAHALGPITVYGPSAGLMPASMHQWQQQGLLDFRISTEVDDSRLLGLFEDFKGWARLHDGHIGDMIHFFNGTQGRPPMVDDTAPSQIRTQIQHFGENGEDAEAVARLQAALFLALAQEYDQHQERLCVDLDAVVDMEQAMFATMGGEADGVPSTGDCQSGTGGRPGSEDPGAFMTEQRLMAWARMAYSDPSPPRVYVTSSAAVWDYLKGGLPDAIELPTWYLSRPEDQPDLKQQRYAVLEALSVAPDLKAVPQVPEVIGRSGDGALVIEWIGSSVDLFETLLPGQSASRLGNNAVMGLVQTARQS